MSGSRQISPTRIGRRGFLPVLGRGGGLRRAGRRCGARPRAAFGAAAGGLRRALGHAVGGAARNRRADARPGLAAAEEAQHAALDLELIGADRLDRRAVDLAVLGVVDLAFPLVGAGLLLHVDQDRHAQCRPVLF